MAEIRVYDSEDRILNSLIKEICEVQSRILEINGLGAGIRRIPWVIKERELSTKYDQRLLELGLQKPSGYHG